jgi:hypothetical protein
VAATAGDAVRALLVFLNLLEGEANVATKDLLAILTSIRRILTRPPT